MIYLFENREGRTREEKEIVTIAKDFRSEIANGRWRPLLRPAAPGGGEVSKSTGVKRNPFVF
jgi:hypothetical protein